MIKSHAEEMFRLLAIQTGEPASAFLREFRFHPTRRWRFDFAWPFARFAVEIEGITPAGSRHQRIQGFLADAEKYEAAMELGWMIYRVPSPWMDSRPHQVIDIVRRRLLHRNH